MQYIPDPTASVVLNDAEYRPPASAEVRGRGNVKFGAKCRVVTGVPAAAARPPYSILAFVLLPGCRDGAAGRDTG